MSRSTDDTDLQRYCDGELGARRARQVRERLQTDPEARGRVEALESMRGMLQQAASASADEADFSKLWGRVRSGIEREQPPSLSERISGWFRRWGIVAATATAAVVVALAVLLWPAGVTPPANNDAVIESLDVGPEAVGTIFTITGPKETGDTTVIWVTETSAEGDK